LGPSRETKNGIFICHTVIRIMITTPLLVDVIE